MTAPTGIDFPLNTLAAECRRISEEHGFWEHETLTGEINVEDGPFEIIEIDNPSIWAEKIALIHSEASEMLEALREDDEDALGEECADLMIRLGDFVNKRNIDLDRAVERKMEKNRSRPYKHGRKF